MSPSHSVTVSTDRNEKVRALRQQARTQARRIPPAPADPGLPAGNDLIPTLEQYIAAGYEESGYAEFLVLLVRELSSKFTVPDINIALANAHATEAFERGLATIGTVEDEDTVTPPPAATTQPGGDQVPPVEPPVVASPASDPVGEPAGGEPVAPSQSSQPEPYDPAPNTGSVEPTGEGI